MLPENEINSTAISIKLSLRLINSPRFQHLHDARMFLRSLNERALRIQNLLILPHFQTTLLLDVLARFDQEQPYMHLTAEVEDLQKKIGQNKKELKKDHDDRNVCHQQLNKEVQGAGKKVIEKRLEKMDARIVGKKKLLEQLAQEYEAVKEKRRTSRDALIKKAIEMSKATGLYDTSIAWINTYLKTTSFYNETDGIKNYDLLEPLKDYLENLFDYEKNDVLFEKYPYHLERNTAKLFFNVRKDNLKTYISRETEKVGENSETVYYLNVFGCRFRVTLGKNKSRNAKRRIEQMFDETEKDGLWYEPRASYLSVEHIQNNFQKNYDGNEDRIYLNLVLQENIRLQPVQNNTRIMGIDMGVNNPLYISIKEAESNDSLLMLALGKKEKDTQMRSKTIRRIETLQKEIAVAKAVKKSRAIIDLSKKIRGYFEDYYHQLSKEIIDHALKHRVGIIKLENLDFEQRFKSTHFILKHWNFRSLQNKIAYKAARVGATVQWVDPANTSKNCMYCGQKGTNFKLKLERGKNSSAQDAFEHNCHVFICGNTNWKSTGKTCYGYVDIGWKWKKQDVPECKKCKQKLVKITLSTIDGKEDKLLGNQKSKTLYICNNGQCDAKGNWFMPQHRDANAAVNIANAVPLAATDH